MNMKLNSAQLEAFLTVAQTLHFTQAAEILHVTQSALSQRIAKLEEELQTTLFIRDRTSIRLTEDGMKVLRFCQLNSHAEEELLQNLTSSAVGLAGTLKIAGFSSVTRSLLLPALKNLMSQNQKLGLKLHTREVYELESLLQSSEVDYIITTHKSHSDDRECIFLGFEENVLIKSKKHAVSPIYLDHDERDQTTKNYLSHTKQNNKPQAFRFLDDVYGIIDGVKSGFGLAVVPKHLIVNDKEVEVIEPKKIYRIEIYLQFYKQAFYQKKHDLVVSEIINYFAEKLSKAK